MTRETLRQREKKKPGKGKNKGKENDPKSEENCSNGSPPADAVLKLATTQKHGGEASDDQGKGSKNDRNSPKNAPASDHPLAVKHKGSESGCGTGGSGGGEKKKKKGQKGNNTLGGPPGSQLSDVPASTELPHPG